MLGLNVNCELFLMLQGSYVLAGRSVSCDSWADRLIKNTSFA